MPRYPDNPGFHKATAGGARRGTASRSTLDRTAGDTRTRQATVAGIGEVLSIPYGRVRVGAHVTDVAVYNGKLRLILTWCQGPVTEVETFLVNGEPPGDGITFQHFLGTQEQDVRPVFSPWKSGFDDRRRGVCCTIVTLDSTEEMKSFPRFEAIIKGLQVFDPRISSTMYSTNPALHLANFITRHTGRNVFNVSAAADACDQNLSGHKRRESGLLLDTVNGIWDWIDTLRTYAGCYVLPVEGGYKLVPNRPASPVAHFGPDKILKGSLRIEGTGAADHPTVMQIRWTDTSRPDKESWTERPAFAYAAGVLEGTTPYRESAVSLPGIQSHQQAYREAVERLNTLRLVNLRGECTLFSEAVQIELGDVVTLTHPLGLENKPVRVLSCEPQPHGKWHITWEEYQENAYSDTVQAAPTVGDTTLPDPANPAPPTGFEVVEQAYQLQNLTYSTRFVATWNHSAYPYDKIYQIRVIDIELDQAIYEASTRGTSWSSGPLQELRDYLIEVRTTSPLGYIGEAVSEELRAQGKHLPPGNVPSISGTVIGAGVVRLSWSSALDVDIWRYEVRRGGSNWDTATLVDRVDTLTLVVQGLPTGSHVFRVKAIDSVQQYSEQAATTTVNITAPPPPPSIDGFEVGGQVRLFWEAAPNPYVRHYEVRYGPVEGFSWAEATVVDRVDALRLITNDVPEGTWRFAVRSIDTNGVSSTSGPTIDVTVTLDASAFLAERVRLEDPSLTNMSEIFERGVRNRRWLTDAGQSWADLFPNAMNTYTDPLATYHTAVDSEWLSETVDFAVILSGQFTAEINPEALAGSYSAQLELSVDDVDWDTYPSLTTKTTAQYARVRIAASEGSTLLVTAPPCRVTVNVTPVKETGTGTSASSGPTPVVLGRTYAFAKSIVVQPIGNAALNSTVDNVSMGEPESGFDVYIFDDEGNQVVADFFYTFEGV